MNIVDRLYEKVEEVGVVCLGLDTNPSYIPCLLYTSDAADE